MKAPRSRRRADNEEGEAGVLEVVKTMCQGMDVDQRWETNAADGEKRDGG